MQKRTQRTSTEEPFVRICCQFLGGECDRKCNSESNMERDAFYIRQSVIHRDLVREDLCRRRNHRYHSSFCVSLSLLTLIKMLDCNLRPSKRWPLRSMKLTKWWLNYLTKGKICGALFLCFVITKAIQHLFFVRIERLQSLYVIYIYITGRLVMNFSISFFFLIFWWF